LVVLVIFLVSPIGFSISVPGGKKDDVVARFHEDIQGGRVFLQIGFPQGLRNLMIWAL